MGLFQKSFTGIKDLFLFRVPIYESLKPNTCNNKARRIKFHRNVLQFLPRDHGGFRHKNQKMSDFLGISQKVRHFLILVPKTAIVEHIDGTSGAKRGCNTDWTLERLEGKIGEAPFFKGSTW